LTIWHCILNAEVTKTHSFRLFFGDFSFRLFFGDFAYWVIPTKI